MAASGAGNRARSEHAGKALSTETEAERESETGTEVSVLHAVWPDISARHTGNGMETGESQQGIARSGRRDDQDDRRKRRRSFTISRRNRAVAAAENLPAATSTAGMDRESEWKVEATGHPDDTRSGSADGHVPDRGTDIRGGLSGV